MSPSGHVFLTRGSGSGYRGARTACPVMRRHLWRGLECSPGSSQVAAAQSPVTPEPCASVCGFAVTVCPQLFVTDKERRLSRLVVGGEAASTWRAFEELALEVTADALATLTCRGRSSRTRGMQTKSVTP
ncbi:hypothetical protein HJG60_011565 [Phyllostomus discolor]|uniref:Uncharacterized protein n=1 Tax=Phyllostomus discolor TaxID=89673 RepID=A0A833ZTZ1_9CHIR|nr:hypothetical protein HJG60_011565 [Phyllostomus discolor]